MESCPPWLRFREGGNELSLTGSFSTTTSSFLPHFLLPHSSLVFTNMKDEIQGGERGEMNEGYKSSWWRWGQAGALLCWTTFWLLNVLLTYIFGLRTKKSEEKKQPYLFLLFLVNLFFFFPSTPISLFPSLITIVFLDTLFFSSCWVRDIWPQLLLLLQPGLKHEPWGILQLWPPVLGHVPDEERPNRQRTLW